MSVTEPGDMLLFYAAAQAMLDDEIAKVKRHEDSWTGPGRLVAYGERVALERASEKLAKIAREQAATT